jgi:hypothetical protein
MLKTFVVIGATTALQSFSTAVAAIAPALSSVVRDVGVICVAVCQVCCNRLDTAS